MEELMRKAATRRVRAIHRADLYMAIETGESKWNLGFKTAPAQPVRERMVEARDAAAVLLEVARAKRRFGLRVSARVICCYEAGREGFWLQRFLAASGIETFVVDPTSFEVRTGRRRVKTDRVDLVKLLRMLVEYCGGEERTWSVVNVPTVEDEDRRQLHRELDTLKHEQTRLTNRIKGLLASQGVRLDLVHDFVTRLKHARLWDGSQVPGMLRARLEREWERVQLIRQQMRSVEAERRRRLRTSSERAYEVVRQLHGVKAIGLNSAWTFSMEFFGWRAFRNRRQVGALAGLVSTPRKSGEMDYELGISKAGNRYIRAMAVEIAWCWLRFQPRSALSRWYQARFAHGGKRMRRIGIVALARKLLIALWRYVETGALPQGAKLRTA
jgi:transposase